MRILIEQLRQETVAADETASQARAESLRIVDELYGSMTAWIERHSSGSLKTRNCGLMRIRIVGQQLFTLGSSVQFDV